jgi:hypothetical protein
VNAEDARTPIDAQAIAPLAHCKREALLAVPIRGSILAALQSRSHLADPGFSHRSVEV